MSVLISPGRVHTYGLALNLYLGSFVSPDVVLAILVIGVACCTSSEASFSRSGTAARRNSLMRIFIFKSETSPDLRAFSDDQGGHRLPAQFRRRHATGVVCPEAMPPHNLNRDLIEASITKSGFQLWRTKK